MDRKSSLFLKITWGQTDDAGLNHRLSQENAEKCFETVGFCSKSSTLWHKIYQKSPKGYSKNKAIQHNKRLSEPLGKLSEKKGAINREFPDEWRNLTMDKIEKAAKSGDKSAQKAKKLLKDKRFDKTDNRK